MILYYMQIFQKCRGSKLELKGKTALITGGSDGYGNGIALVLKEQGCSVWITGRIQPMVQEIKPM
jgi:NAD(P)-dependent dehydrogenase (short-subunit alcohol dehydrogenase family)